MDNGRYKKGQHHIGRTGAEGGGTAVGKAVSQRKEASKHNEASTSGSIVRSEMLLIQCRMAKADYFVQLAESVGTVDPRD